MEAGWIVGISFIASTLLILLSVIAYRETFTWNDLFVVIALGLFISVGRYYTSISIKNILLRYLIYNVSILKGGIKYD
jgi:hypothetical protein